MQLNDMATAPNAQLRILNPHVSASLHGYEGCALPTQAGSMSLSEQGFAGGVSSFGYSGTIAHTVLSRTPSGSGLVTPLLMVTFKRRNFAWWSTEVLSPNAATKSNTFSACLLTLVDSLTGISVVNVR